MNDLKFLRLAILFNPLLNSRFSPSGKEKFFAILALSFIVITVPLAYAVFGYELSLNIGPYPNDEFYGIAVNATHLHVANATDGNISIFDLDGNYAKTITSPGFDALTINGTGTNSFVLGVKGVGTDEGVYAYSLTDARTAFSDFQGDIAGPGDFDCYCDITTNSTHVFVIDPREFGTGTSVIYILDQSLQYKAEKLLTLNEISYYLTSNSTHILHVVDNTTTGDWVRILDINTLAEVGSFLPYGTGDGESEYVNNLAMNGTHIFVADNNETVIKMFDLSGNFVTKFGSFTTDIVSIDVSTNDDEVFASEYNLGDGIIKKFIKADIVASSSSSSSSSNGGGGGSDKRHLTKPTFGLDHHTHAQIVTGGFSFNDKTFTISDNWHTPFSKQNVKIGQDNIFTAKVYAEKDIKIQEFLFGISKVGDAHNAELGVEVHYDYQGNVEKVLVVQKTDIVDMDYVDGFSTTSKCTASDIVERCITTSITLRFLEPLQYDVMAIKAIDQKGRTIITYLNDGFDISGDSLNPMNTEMIPSNQKSVGLIKVTQNEKYSPFWTAEDGRVFERNDFGTFTMTPQEFTRHQDSGEPITRLHSDFPSYQKGQALLAEQTMRGLCPGCFDEPYDKINNVVLSEITRANTPKLENPEVLAAMYTESQKAQKIMDEMFSIRYSGLHYD